MPIDGYNWPTFRRVIRREKRIEQMIERLDVDVSALARRESGDLLVAIHRACIACTKGEQCRSWLGGEADASPDFCPILGIILDDKAHPKPNG